MPFAKPEKIANRTPCNLAFCQFKGCQYLKGNNKCKKEECVFNNKLIVYWEKLGIWKGE